MLRTGDDDEYSDEVAHPAEFVRASRLYDPDRGESVPFDWDKGQPLADSQAEIECALAAETATDGGR